jgi:hypothetical protein
MALSNFFNGAGTVSPAFSRKLDGAMDPSHVFKHNQFRRTRTKPFDLKYPHTVGDAPSSLSVDYNTNLSSEFATTRASEGIDKEAIEPFVFFEFMEIIPKLKEEKNERRRQYKQALKPGILEGKKAAEVPGALASALKNNIEYSLVGNINDIEENEEAIAKSGEVITKGITEAKESGLLKPALRQYKGSIAMYMPTDIQINDSIAYNENTRKTFGVIQGLAEGDVDAENVGVKLAAQAGTIGLGRFLGYLGGKMSIGGDSASNLGTLLGAAGVGTVMDEYQRSTGKASNPHDYMAYQNTALRSFTYTFTFLPDSKEESVDVAEIIKQFRHAAHAERLDAVALTVPEHVIISHHGAGDMIQLPPVVIESVNVAYNPNNSSFFIEGGHPVEVGLSVTFKEIVPLYKQDVEGGM